MPAGVPFGECCQEWRNAVDLMDGYKFLRVEDLALARDEQSTHMLPCWSEWDAETMATFWDICGDQMQRMGYTKEGV